MTLDINKKEFLIKNNFKNKHWNSRSLYNIYKEVTCLLSGIKKF